MTYDWTSPYPTLPARRCAACPREFQPLTPNHTYCSVACQQRARRKRRKVRTSLNLPPLPPGGVQSAASGWTLPAPTPGELMAASAPLKAQEIAAMHGHTSVDAALEASKREALEALAPFKPEVGPRLPVTDIDRTPQPSKLFDTAITGKLCEICNKIGPNPQCNLKTCKHFKILYAEDEARYQPYLDNRDAAIRAKAKALGIDPVTKEPLSPRKLEDDEL